RFTAVSCICSLSLHDALPSCAGDAYIEIANFAPSTQDVRVTIRRGTAPILDRQIQINGGEAIHQVIPLPRGGDAALRAHVDAPRSEEHTSELQSPDHIVCRLL